MQEDVSREGIVRVAEQGYLLMTDRGRDESPDEVRRMSLAYVLTALDAALRASRRRRACAQAVRARRMRDSLASASAVRSGRLRLHRCRSSRQARHKHGRGRREGGRRAVGLPLASVRASSGRGLR